jgi:hypothetical protein
LIKKNAINFINKQIIFYLTYENFSVLQGKKLNLIFMATDGKISINKKVTLIFSERVVMLGFEGPTPRVRVKKVTTKGLMYLNFNERMMFGLEHLEKLNA